MAEPLALLVTLSHGSARADGLASAICRLVKDGAELGALVDRDVVGADGEKRAIRAIPLLWLQRLESAVAAGAFEHMSVEAIVARILAPPAAE